MTSSIQFGREAARLPSFRAMSPNERAILSLLQRHSPLSRAELARRTGLALPTVSRLCDQLLREGLLDADAKVMMSSRGQPSMPLSLCADGAFAFGVAVRAEELSVVLVDIMGRERARSIAPIAAPALEDVIAHMAILIARLAAEVEVAPDRVAGVGVALPGFFISEPRRINAPLGMEDWAIEALEQRLGHALGLPVSVENDGTAAAVGERIYGAGRDHESFAYLYVDRGFGGGLIRDGALLRGAHGNAGEFTGLVPPDQRMLRPTLALLLQYAREQGEATANVADLLAGLTPGAPWIDRWVRDVEPVTRLVVSGIAAIFDPAAIVFGGRLPGHVAQRLIDATSFYSVPVRGRDRPFPWLIASALEGDAAALGAAALVFDHYLL
jgi:predicted NBD/HSP70 family sugar kinase